MDLDRYLGLPSPGTASPSDPSPHEGLIQRALRRPLLVGSLLFAAAWFAVVKLRLVGEMVTATGLLIALVAVSGAVLRFWRQERPQRNAVHLAAAEKRLREGDVEAAIAACKHCLANDPTRVERGRAERLLAFSAATELHLQEAILLAEMAELSLQSPRLREFADGLRPLAAEADPPRDAVKRCIDAAMAQ